MVLKSARKIKELIAKFPRKRITKKNLPELGVGMCGGL